MVCSTETAKKTVPFYAVFRFGIKFFLWYAIFSVDVRNIFGKQTINIMWSGFMNKKKVVIIDDEEDLCRLMQMYLVDLDYDVFLANTLHNGMSLMEKVSPDVLFIDNNLPDGLGWDKMHFLLQHYPDCKINLISAYRTTTPEIEKVQGAVQVIEKPLSLHSLRQYL